MKKLHALWAILALFTLSLGFTACSDDDDDAPAPATAIQGKWVSATIDSWDKENGQIVDETSGKNDCMMLEFDANGVGKVYEKVNNNWVVEEETEKIVFKNNILYAYYTDGEIQEIPVKSLQGNTMVVEVYEKETESDGTVYESYSKIVFQKK